MNNNYSLVHVSNIGVWVHFFVPNSKFVFPKEDTSTVSDISQKDLPTDGKYEGFADVNDAIITELKTLLSADIPTGTTCIIPPSEYLLIVTLSYAVCMSG